jgi:putative glutathione S-transferase
VLWDKQQETIVSNESAEIIRMFNQAFDEWGDASVDFYPEPLRAEIYDEAFRELFAVLDELEEILSRHRYLTGGRVTEADWRLFTTLLRFDPVYFGHFKCNLRRIADYPNLSNYLRDLHQVPGVAETVDIPHIKKHYYGSHENVNPTRIVPLGPDVDYSAPHNRDRFRKAA